MTSRLQRDDRGISVVIGSILILGLIVATTVTIRLNYQPIWEKDREAAHMRLVEAQLAALKSQLDRQIDNRTTIPIASPITLGTTSTGFLGGRSDAGELSFAPGNRLYQVASPRLLVQQDNDTNHVGLQETWTTISGTITLENVGTFHSFRLRLSTALQHHAGDSVTITATDADGVFAGDLRVLVSSAGAADWQTNVRVRDATGNILSSVATTYPNDQPQAPLWVDALRSDHRFQNVLAAAKLPIRLSLAVSNADAGAENQDLSAEYAATYTRSGTQLIVGSGGVQRDDYRATYTGGLLRFHADNERFPTQDYHLEHGALLVEQADGSAFRIRPGFDASLIGATTSIVLTVPTLKGTANAFTGASTATVYTNSILPARLQAQAPSLTLTVATSLPDVWTTFWAAELDALPGFVPGTHFTTSSTSSMASVTIYGLTSDPLSMTYDLHLVFRQAEINLEFNG